MDAVDVPTPVGAVDLQLKRIAKLKDIARHHDYKHFKEKGLVEFCLNLNTVVFELFSERLNVHRESDGSIADTSGFEVSNRCSSLSPETSGRLQ